MEIVAPSRTPAPPELRLVEEDERSPGGDAAAAASDFETFLRLLTTQMRNQDPLKPMDSTEFVAQLASFSSVEQQVKSNEKLSAIEDALAGGAGAGLADWIGREVEATAAARFDGSPVDLRVTPAPGATRAQLVARDAETGEEAARQDIDPEAERVVWKGEIDGGPASPGLYEFGVQAFDDSGLISETDARVVSRVRELRLDASGPTLVLDSGATARPEEVSAIFASAPAPAIRDE